MGDPATPTPAQRAALYKQARAIVDSVIDDEAMPHGIFELQVTGGKQRALHAEHAEEVIFKLAQEVVLQAEPGPRVLGDGEGRILTGFTTHELIEILHYVPTRAVRKRCITALALLDPKGAEEFDVEV